MLSTSAIIASDLFPLRSRGVVTAISGLTWSVSGLSDDAHDRSEVQRGVSLAVPSTIVSAGALLSAVSRLFIT